MSRVFITTDAIGLAAFTIVGTDIARTAGFDLGPAFILGVISGTAGGIIRDVLTGERISIFSGEVYALAEAAGSIVFLLTENLGEWVPFIAGMLATLAIRLGAVVAHYFNFCWWNGRSAWTC